MAQVGIVILAWNKLEYTKRCIEKVLQNTNFNYYQIIGVNNGSTDGTREYFDEMEKIYRPHNAFIPVHLEKNVGFGAGMNRGMEVAFHLGNTHACLLNNDVEVTNGWLHAMYDCIEKDDRRGMVQPIVKDFSGNIRECGSIPTINENYCTMADLDKTEDQLRGTEKERIYLNGACLLIKKSFVDEVGMFSSEFFPAYHEETDLCIRGHQAGWKMMFCGDAVVNHHMSVTSREIPDMGSIFWDHWNLILKKYKPYFKELAEKES